jgi:hypothetical protein
MVSAKRTIPINKVRAFMNFLYTEVFLLPKYPGTKFVVHEEYYTPENFVSWHMDIRLGVDVFELVKCKEPNKYYILFRVGKNSVVVSPSTDLETIVRWLDEDAFVKAFFDFFPEAKISFQLPGNQKYIERAKGAISHCFEQDRDDPVFKTLKLRDHVVDGKRVLDSFGMDSYLITDHVGEDIPCSRHQLVIWFETEWLHIMASHPVFDALE